VATQGRSFWVLDDLTLLPQLRPELAKESVHIFQPRPTLRIPGPSAENQSKTEGQNAPGGVVLHYYLKDKLEKDAKVSLEISDSAGALIRRFTLKGEAPDGKIEPKQGMNRFIWDLRHSSAESFTGMIIWGGLQGPRAVPGKYQAKLAVGDKTETVTFEIKSDPRSAATPEDLQAQSQFLLEARDKLSETHRAIKQIRDIRDQLSNLTKRLKDNTEAAEIVASAKDLDKSITTIEEALYQTKSRSIQDVLNYPIRLNNKLVSLANGVSMGDNRPTYQAMQVKQELTSQIDTELSKLHKVVDEDLPRLNDLLSKKRIPGVFPQPAGEKEQKK
jgi:hypothetical protein